MSYVCPICNGFENLNERCSICGQFMEDQGRPTDWFGPYSPYTPLDDLHHKTTMVDAKNHSCVHFAYCKHCEHTHTVLVCCKMEN